MDYSHLEGRELLQAYKKACRAQSMEDIKNMLLLLDAEAARFNLSDRKYAERIEAGFNVACIEGNVEAVKLLMTSPDIPRQCRSFSGFRNACSYKKWDVVEFFIFEFNMHFSAAVEELIIETIDEKSKNIITSYFEKRKLNQKLVHDLPSKENISKVKI